jgi:hypothetical protein
MTRREELIEEMKEQFRIIQGLLNHLDKVCPEHQERKEKAANGDNV